MLKHEKCRKRKYKIKIINNNNENQWVKNLQAWMAARCLYVLFFSFLFIPSSFSHLFVCFPSLYALRFWFVIVVVQVRPIGFFFFIVYQNYCTRSCVYMCVCVRVACMYICFLFHYPLLWFWTLWSPVVQSYWSTEYRLIVCVFACAWASEWVNWCVLCVHKLCENKIQEETEWRH